MIMLHIPIDLLLFLRINNLESFHYIFLDSRSTDWTEILIWFDWLILSYLLFIGFIIIIRLPSYYVCIPSTLHCMYSISPPHPLPYHPRSHTYVTDCHDITTYDRLSCVWHLDTVWNTIILISTTKQLIYFYKCNTIDFR